MSETSESKYPRVNQIEKKHSKSQTNMLFRFPGLESVEDSESSLLELEGVTQYNLRKQNDNKPLDEVDQLVELFSYVSRLEKVEMREFLM